MRLCAAQERSVVQRCIPGDAQYRGHLAERQFSASEQTLVDEFLAEQALFQQSLAATPKSSWPRWRGPR